VPGPEPIRVLSLTHQADAGSGVFAEAVRQRGDELDERCLPAGDPPPAIGDYDAILIFGSSANVDEEDRRPWIGAERELLSGAIASELPVLGVCFGAQLLAIAAGARVERLRSPEIGWVTVRATLAADNDPVLGDLSPELRACQWHSYAFEAPPGTVSLFENERGCQAFRRGARQWGIQFHAEVTAETLDGWARTADGREEAREAGVDLAELRAATPARIGRWNTVGRRVCARFLDTAAAAPSDAGAGSLDATRPRAENRPPAHQEGEPCTRG
jgi:GMP synthase (glutamine-hydrolysing)